MSLFDRWMSNLRVSKSSSSSTQEATPAKGATSRPSQHQHQQRHKSSTSSDESDNPSVPSRHTYRTAGSLRPPQLQPSQESRVVRTGPQKTRRKSLIRSSHRGSGDEDQADLQSRDTDATSLRFLDTNQLSARYKAHRQPRPPRLPVPKQRSNNRFFQQGPLSVEQIRNLLWVEEVASEDHYTQTARSLNLFRQRKRHCDVRLSTESGRLYAHKAVLVTFSQDLQNRLESSSLWKSGKISVDLGSRGLETPAIEMVAAWMYTGNMRCNIKDNLDRILTVAESLKIPHLIKICQKLASDVPVHIPAHAARSESRILSLSDGHSEKSVGPTKSNLNFYSTTSADEFLRWSAEKLAVFLASDVLAVDSELDVYKAILKWLNFSRSSRIGNLDNLMNCVRWVYLNSEEVVNVKHVDSALFNEPAVSSKAAMGQWQRDLLRRGIQPPVHSFPVNRVEQFHLRKLREQREQNE